MNSIKTATIRRRNLHGFTLLEVLVALFVLSIGLLGMAALQSVGLRSSHGAYLASQAAVLAYDMADRIRANPGNAGAYVGDADCAAVNAPLAAADVADWGCLVADLLPSGVGRVESPPGDDDTFTVIVEWEDLQNPGNDPWDFQLTIQL